MTDKQCISKDELVLLQGEQIEPNRRIEIESHLAVCGNCRSDAAELFLLNTSAGSSYAAPDELKQKALNMVEPIAAAEVDDLPKFRSFNWFRPILTFASVLVICFGLFGVYLYYLDADRASDELFRDGKPAAKSVVLSSPANNYVTSRKETVFDWEPVESAASYKFVVSDESGDIIEEIDLDQTKIIRSFDPEQEHSYLFWQIKTRLADGTEIESESRKIFFK